jgi:hypothetical protein
LLDVPAEQYMLFSNFVRTESHRQPPGKNFLFFSRLLPVLALRKQVFYRSLGESVAMSAAVIEAGSAQQGDIAEDRLLRMLRLPSDKEVLQGVGAENINVRAVLLHRSAHPANSLTALLFTSIFSAGARYISPALPFQRWG